MIFLICCYLKKDSWKAEYLRPCDRHEMINILDVILHLFKNLDKVAVRRLMIFQIVAEIIRSIFIGNIINFVAERLKKQYQRWSSTHMAVVRRLVSLSHAEGGSCLGERFRAKYWQVPWIPSLPSCWYRRTKAVNITHLEEEMLLALFSFKLWYKTIGKWLVKSRQTSLAFY